MGKQKTERFMEKLKKGMAAVSIFAVLLVVALACLYYYVVLPPINIHAPGFWWFVIFIAAVLTVIAAMAGMHTEGEKYVAWGFLQFTCPKVSYKNRALQVAFKAAVGCTIVLVCVYLVGSLLSSKVINAAKYQKLLTVSERDFTQDIHEVSYDQIPILDRDSATTIGNRVMGTMVDMVSQYEVSDMYAQINYQNKPVRVAPLQYGSFIKWFTNRQSGIPAYIRIDMTTQQAECVRLKEGIRYSTSEHFGRNIYRHLRFSYPTYIFDDINFEIDENGTPFWICPVKKYNIGLFGGVTIGRVVICNAVTGEMQDYVVEDVPEWVDKVYSAKMMIDLYDYHGTLKHGYFNSVLSQRDCLVTTDGYNYIALDDDVWVYTGVTSVGQDKSNVGFVLMNQRTLETRYYVISGAEENSAMSSAEGKVQHLGYQATFPLLLNINGEPTYFMALKDSAGLVKSYAMLNIEKYQNVAIGDTVSQCETNYRQLLFDAGIVKQETPQVQEKQISGIIQKIAPAVIDGNSHYYLMLEGQQAIFDVKVADLVDVVRLNVGDTVALTYYEEQGLCVVEKIK